MPQINKDEISLDLLDLMLTLLKHWKSLVLAVIVGAVLGAGFFMMQDAPSVSAYEPNSTNKGYMLRAANLRISACQLSELVNVDDLSELSSDTAMGRTLASYIESLTNLEAYFSAEDMAYYSANYLDEETRLFPYAIPEAEELLISEESVKTAKDAIKPVVVGILLLCVCWGAWICLVYLFDGCIKSTEDALALSGLPLVGSLAIAPPNSLLAKHRIKADSLAYVSTALSTLDRSGLLLCGDSSLNAVRAAMDMLAEQAGIEPVSRSDAALKEAKNSDGLVLVLELGKSKRADFIRELEVCQLQKLPVVGLITVL